MVNFTYLWTPVHGGDGSLDMQVWLENELLGNLVSLLLLASGAFVVFLLEEVTQDVELLIECSLNDSAGLAYEFLELFRFHFSFAVFFRHQLEAFHELLLFSLGLLLFRLWHWWQVFSYKRTANKATAHRLLASRPSDIWAPASEGRVHRVTSHISSILLTLLVMLLLFLDVLQVLEHVSIDNAALHLSIISDRFFL
jgi:hypothetical protein